MSTKTTTCEHLPQEVATPVATTCGNCESDFNLRVCTTCGNVGCCESQQAHNRAHFESTGHAVIKSMPVNDHSFTWCYECNIYV